MQSSSDEKLSTNYSIEQMTSASHFLGPTKPVPSPPKMKLINSRDTSWNSEILH
jgi:hypothetical protein